MTDAVLNSNSGEHSLEFLLPETFDSSGDADLVVTVRLNGRHYRFCHDRDQDLSMQVDAVWLCRDRLGELCEALNQWLQLPLEVQAATSLTGRFQLMLGGYDELEIVLGDRADTISGKNPVVSIRLRVGRLGMQYHFVTDQSCLRAFAVSLASWFGE